MTPGHKPREQQSGIIIGGSLSGILQRKVAKERDSIVLERRARMADLR
jgi:hypothetical protein